MHAQVVSVARQGIVIQSLPHGPRERVDISFTGGGNGPQDFVAAGIFVAHFDDVAARIVFVQRDMTTAIGAANYLVLSVARHRWQAARTIGRRHELAAAIHYVGCDVAVFVGEAGDRLPRSVSHRRRQRINGRIQWQQVADLQRLELPHRAVLEDRRLHSAGEIVDGVLFAATLVDFTRHAMLGVVLPSAGRVVWINHARQVARGVVFDFCDAIGRVRDLRDLLVRADHQGGLQSDGIDDFNEAPLLVVRERGGIAVAIGKTGQLVLHVEGVDHFVGRR